jgi:hypothetical protein
MINLITCCDQNFLDKAVKCLTSSFEIDNSIKYTIYIFGDKEAGSEIPDFISVKRMPQNIKNLNDPYLFAYKYWSILDSFLENQHVIYTDSTHFINKSLSNVINFYSNDCLLLRYKDGQFLVKDWTTKKCIAELEGENYLHNSQIWAGFQAYKNTIKNKEFVKKILDLCLNTDIGYPLPSEYKPDGEDGDCLYHRNDQSILSIEALKNNIYPEFNESIDLSFGDFQSVCVFYPDDYSGDVLNNLNRYVYPRYFKK